MTTARNYADEELAGRLREAVGEPVFPRAVDEVTAAGSAIRVRRRRGVLTGVAVVGLTAALVAWPGQRGEVPAAAAGWGARAVTLDGPDLAALGDRCRAAGAVPSRSPDFADRAGDLALAVWVDATTGQSVVCVVDGPDSVHVDAPPQRPTPSLPDGVAAQVLFATTLAAVDDDGQDRGRLTLTVGRVAEGVDRVLVEVDDQRFEASVSRGLFALHTQVSGVFSRGTLTAYDADGNVLGRYSTIG